MLHVWQLVSNIRYSTMQLYMNAGVDTGELSTGSAVATTAVVCSLVFLVIGVLVGVLCGHWTTVYRFSKQGNLKQSNPLNNSETTPPAGPVPVYEELVSPELLSKEKDIELKENVAYGN